MQFSTVLVRWIYPIWFFFFLQNCANDTRSDNQGLKKSPPLQSSPEIEQNLSPFEVQVAAFKLRSNAEDLVSRLLVSDFGAYVVRDSTGVSQTLCRVRVGRFSNERLAFAALRLLQEQGFGEAYLIKQESVRLQSAPVLETFESQSKSREQIKRGLTSTGGCSHPRWSPNGREIAFFRSGPEAEGIYTIGTGGGHVSRIIESKHNREVTTEFVWSPSSKRLAVVVRETNIDQKYFETLYTVEKNGIGRSTPDQLYRSREAIADLRWSPDEAYIAFTEKTGELDNSFKRVHRIGFVSPKKLKNATMLERKKDVWQIEVTHSGGELLAGGWKNAQEYLYLSTGREETHSLQRILYQMWSYDFEAGESRIIWTSLKEDTIHGFKLDPEKEYALLSSGSDIIVLDLYSGKETDVPGSDSDEKTIRSLEMTGSRIIYFIAGTEFWTSTISGKHEYLGFEIASQDFTISPSGRKICFSQDGDLFTIRLPQ